MTDTSVQPVAESTSGSSQIQRVINTFVAPSKTFNDIKNGHRNWLIAFLVVLITGWALWGTITSEKTAVTWKSIFQEQQAKMPEFAKRMQENAIEAQPPEQQAAMRQKMETAGPRQQMITWLLAPGGLLLMNLICALVLWPTINFGFGGKATFGSVLAVTMYATLVLWPVKCVLSAIALFAGMSSLDLQNIAGTNAGYYMEVHQGPLYAIATALDPIVIWNLAITSIGLAIVAGVKRSSGYVAVFGWWALLTIIFVGLAAAFAS
jgi:ABC-type multidrug transport system fused ATPase/permease subunit